MVHNKSPSSPRRSVNRVTIALGLILFYGYLSFASLLTVFDPSIVLHQAIPPSSNRTFHVATKSFMALHPPFMDGKNNVRLDQRPNSPLMITPLANIFQNDSVSITLQEANNKSSVDYFACCGLGHRMSKMCDANVVAKLRNWALRIHWGICPINQGNHHVEVFEYFFGPQPLHELASVTSTGLTLKIANEAGGFKKLIRTGAYSPTTCPCSPQITEIHNQFYVSLRDERFRFRQEVMDFVHTYFDNYTVIGIHVRAGNGEEGDFVRKGRGIADPQGWIHNVSRQLIQLSQSFPTRPRLFVATDTPSIITSFQTELKDASMDVIEYTQSRPAEGSGIVFGEAFLGHDTIPDGCLDHWKNALMDMMILSHADVVIAGRPSSFTQSLPITVALAKPNFLRRVPYTYCEMHPSGNATHCYQDFQEWCCTGRTDFHLDGIRRYEFRRMPFQLEKQKFRISKRTPRTSFSLSKCSSKTGCFLPYQWGL